MKAIFNFISSFLRKTKNRQDSFTHSIDVEGLNKVFYGSYDESFSNKLELVSLDNLRYSFLFANKNNFDLNCSFKVTGIAKNIDPEGLCEMDVFDPEGEGNPTEVYYFENDYFMFSIYMPLVVAQVVGIKIEFKQENNCRIKEYRANLEYKPNGKDK